MTPFSFKGDEIKVNGVPFSGLSLRKIGLLLKELTLSNVTRDQARRSARQE
jgi:hypothetical protein